ncbi:MAG: DUF4159 domain-containing protein, partial [Alphaproteobacteria bacterium]|nr:DUF4159 domain-containing protein [Alphaproteobacteria bacterium]
GQVLAREPLHFGVDSASASARMSLPAELRGRLARLDLEDVASAASVVLVDEQWGRRPVGLVSGSPLKADLPLLGDVYYLERALSPRFETRRGEIGELLRRELSMLVLADVGRLDPAESAAVLPWMDKGGILVRFAGPRLAAEAGEPLPVRLRAGERTAGGALTWNQPLALAPFEDATPFAGLAVPPDVRVSTQVLAEPGPDLAARTWARLSDGTPLVTAERRGQGWLVLVHATANAEWSNLALSGLFEAMMERLALLGRGTVEGETQPLPPLRTLDGFGREGTPPGTALPIPAAAFASVVPGPGRPPGVYGRADAQRALNLSAAVQTLDSIARPPAEARVYGFDHLGREIDLKPWFLAAALGLFVLDHGVALWLGRALILILVLFPRGVRAGGEDPFALAAALQPRLAYVRTGDAGTDGASRLGLAALTGVLEERTAAVLGPPMEVDVERDPLLFFPLLYWPLPAPSLSADGAVATKVEDYLRHGGMIVFDTRDSAAGSDSLRELARVVDIPPLTRIPSDHVLGRSFYLLRDFSGRVAGGEVWVAADPEGNDGVSPVIVVGNDLAGAWARGEGGGKPLFPVIPGGEMQRESAYRLGVNLVMYALTGNYKSDQVHLPAIMERLSR